jgi:inhibitor of cysteine peptidase
MIHQRILPRPSLPILFLLMCLAASLAQAQQASSNTKAKAPSSDVTLTERDNGADTDLTIGSALVVKLPANPSTGYNWTVVGEPSPLKLHKSSFRKGATQGSSVGASGTSVFQFSASSSGMATLTLVYRRSWEYNIAPIKTFTVRVNVR